MNTILVLTDFSEAATNAARFSAGFASQLNASRILLYHCSSLSSTGIPNVTGYVPGTESVSQKQDLVALRNELLETGSTAARIDVYNDDQPLGQGIESLVNAEKVDLVAMGATEKGDLGESLFGGNTMTIVNRCTKPLLVVPKGVKFQMIRNILLASDLRKVQQTIPFPLIKSVMGLLDAKLYVLNVDYRDKHFRPETIMEQAELHKAFDNMHAEFRYIDHEDTAEGILSFAEINNVHLIITVKKEHGLFGELFHRSVSKKLIFESGIPLLVLKQNNLGQGRTLK